MLLPRGQPWSTIPIWNQQLWCILNKVVIENNPIILSLTSVYHFTHSNEYRFYLLQASMYISTTLIHVYSLFQKKRTFNSNFFCGPPGGGEPKIHMVDYVNGSSTHAQFYLLKNLQPFWRYFKIPGGMSQNKNCSSEVHSSPKEMQL